MSKVQTVKFLFVLWAVLFCGSLALRFLTAGDEPLGMALGRGFSLIIGQILAAGAAVMCWNSAKLLPEKVPLRRIGQVPMAATMLVCAYVLWSVFAAVRSAAV